MNLAIFALEDLQDANSALMTVTPLRSTANVGVSATCQILKHHIAAARADDLDTVSNSVNRITTAIQYLVSI